jgi:hypothetical protein
LDLNEKNAMKFNLFSLVCLGVLPLVVACSDNGSPKDSGSGVAVPIAEGRSRSDMQMETYEIDLGTVYQRLSYDLEFPFVVNGPDPIVLSEAIDTSCGCTKAYIRADWDPSFEGKEWPVGKEIPAGARGTVVAVFDGSLYEEEKASTITVRGNFLSNKVTLGVKAFIEPIFQSSPAQVNFKDLQLIELKEKEAFIDVKVTAMKPFEVLRWVKVTPGIRVEEIGESEIIEEGRMVRHFRVTATADLPEGRLASALIAETDLGENLEFRVAAVALGPVRYAPQTMRLSFGIFDQGPSRSRVLKLYSTGSDLPQPEFEIVGAAAAVMSAELDVKEAGKRYFLKVTIAENTPIGRYDGLLRVSFPEGSGIPKREVVLSALIR